MINKVTRMGYLIIHTIKQGRPNTLKVKHRTTKTGVFQHFSVCFGMLTVVWGY